MACTLHPQNDLSLRKATLAQVCLAHHLTISTTMCVDRLVVLTGRGAGEERDLIELPDSGRSPPAASGRERKFATFGSRPIWRYSVIGPKMPETGQQTLTD